MATEYRQRPGMGDHFDDEDLVMSSAQQRRNWRGILIALMVIVAVLAMIVTSVVLLTPPQPEELSDSYSDSENGDRTGSDYYYNQRANDELWWRHRGMRTLRLSDILSDSANIKVFNGTWISGTEIFYVTGSGDLAIMEIMADGITQMTHSIMSKKTLQKLKGPLVSFELSHDRNHVLIGHQAKKMFRYSKTARYTVYTVSTRQMTPITLEDHRNHRNVTTSAELQPYLLHAQWHKISPTTEKNVESMALIAVYRYDVYYIPWSLETSTAGMVTNIGKNNVTIDSQMSNVTNSSYTPLSTPSLNDKHKNGGNNSDNNTSSHKLIWKPWPYGPVRRITTSGSGASVTAAGIVSNGVADYLYEMEILKRSPAIWPSSGRYLLYATFDDRRVGEYKYSVYTKGERPHNNVDDGDTEKHSKQRKPKRRKRRLRRNSKPEDAPGTTEDDSTSEYYLYPHIRTLKYPKANTPNPVVTLSVIVNLDQLENPQVQPKIRTLTPPPIFKDTDDYYFTAVQWVSDGGVGDGVGSHEIDDEKTGAAAAEVCVVWLNRAQNTSVTTLCKSPMWMCQETQVINAVGAIGGGSGIRGGQGSETFGSDRARRRYRRNGGGLQKSSHEAVHEVKNNSINASSSYQEDRRRRRQPHQHGQHKHGGQHQHNGHHSRRRRDEYVNTGGYEVPRGRYGGWVDATVGGAGGGVPSTGGGVSDGSFRMISATTWWSGGPNINDGGENFVGDDGYAGIAGFGSTGTGAVYSMAALVRKGWETGDKELTPRAPVFAMDGQGYVSVAPVRDDEHDDDEDQDIKGGVRLRRPTVKQSRDRNAKSRSQSSIGKYYAQVVAVNITKKLLAPLTFGEFDDDNDNDSNKEDQKKSKVVTKSWTVVKILAWDQRTDMIYFLAVPSGRGAPHHRHLYAVKFTSAASSSTVNTDAGYRMGHHHQQQFRKTYRHSNRSRPVCLSCDIGITGNIRRRERREFAGKQNRMDEARDGRLRQQQRERWENLKEEEEDNEEEAATAEEAERRQQRNRRQQQREMQNRGMLRHCTYFDAQFSRDGSHYALVCLGPSVPYVTLHRIVLDEIDNAEDNSDGSGSGDEADSVPLTAQKMPKDSSYSFELIALIENNTRLQDKYTNRVLLPGTRTFQLRLSGGRKLTTSGGLHFNDPLAAADYYSNGGDNQQHFSTKKRPDSDPLTVAQVRLYLPLGVYDPEADPRPEFMSNHIKKSANSDKVDTINLEVTTKTSDSSSSKHSNRRRRRSSSSASSSHDNNDAGGDGSKQQRRPRKKQRQRRLKKLYPMLVVVNSDPGSQAITDRFSDRLGYTTGLLCSGSLGRTLPSASGRSSAGSRYSGNKWDRQRQRGRRDRRSPATRYYSSGHSDDYDDDSYDYGQNNDDYSNNNEYVVAVIDTGRGTWARGYESLLALNYGDGNDGYGDESGEDEIGPGGLLGTADLRDQLEAVEYLLSSSTATSDGFKDNGQGYYSEDRPRGSGSRDRSRWFSSTSQSNRRYYSDDDDYYDDDEEYDDSIDKNDNEDYYYYYYSNDGDNGDYGDDNRGDNFYRDDDGKRSRRDRRSASDTKANTEALRLPYVDASKVALLGGGPTSPSTPPSVYGGYAAARMALWQTIYGGAPIEKKSDESGDKGNRKEPVAIRSSFKCAVTMAPVCSWRLYASAFAERYYGYYGGNDRDNWMSYDRSDLIPLTPSLNESSLSPSSSGKGINLLVMHGTADTTIHPQNSMMLVRGVMQQQQQQFIPTGLVSSVGRRNNNSTASGKRKAGEFPTRVGAIRVSQLVIPDADLSNSRMATDIENGSPIDHHHQLLHSIFGHITQYLATECFTSVGDGNRGRGFRTRGRRLRKRRRRWRTGNRDQDKSEDQQQQQRGEEHQQQQQNQRSDKSNSDTSNESGGGGGDRSSGGRYRRHDIDSNQQISESSIKNNMVLLKNSVNGAHGYNIITKNVSWLNSYLANFTIPNNSNNRSNNASKRRDRYDDDEAEEVDDEAEEVDEEDDEGEDSNDEYYDSEDNDEEDSEDGDNDDDE